VRTKRVTMTIGHAGRRVKGKVETNYVIDRYLDEYE
jgi:hypothetical protein